MQRSKSELITTTRTRNYKIFIDSRDHVSHINNNPSNYVYRLTETIPNVTKIRLLSFRIPYSPTFVVIRSSNWFAAGTPFIDLDNVHKLAVDLNGLIRVGNVEQSTVVATLYKNDGTISLNVIEVFTFVSYETDTPSTSRFRTYDVFVCSGTILTTAQDDWRIQYAASTDTDLVDLGLTEAVDSSIAVNVLDENMYLSLNIGGNQGRLHSLRTVYPAWKSFQVYRRSDTVSNDGLCYVCLVNHMSLIFAQDVLTAWKEIPAAKMENGPADNAFYVVETNEPNEAIIMASANHDEITMDVAPTNVSQITIQWNTRRGSHFIFPISSAIKFLSFTDSPPAVLQREYRFHTLMLELEYQETTQMHASNGPPASNGPHASNGSRLGPSPSFLMPSTAGSFGPGPLRGWP